MKITDLKENDVIHINSKKVYKEFKKICKYFYNPSHETTGSKDLKELKSKFGYNFCIKIVRSKGYNFICHASKEWYEDNNYNVLDGNLFIDNKKSNKLEKRISKLESKVEGLINQNLHKSELTELPEKCVVEINQDNINFLTDYMLKNKHMYNSYSDNWILSTGYFFKIVKEGIIRDGHSVSRELKDYEGYTEISFSDFERLVLGNESKDVEIGKWYKSTYPGHEKILLYITDFKDEDNIKGYGFTEKSKWDNDDEYSWGNSKYLTQATTQEVEEALKNEAVKRGFRKGVTFKSAASVDEFILDGDLIYHESKNSLTGYMGCLFIDGKWAEIVQDNHEEIDWSIPGQIVKGEYTTAITTGKHNNSLFEGFVIKVTVGSDVNHLCKTLIKEYFSLAKGEIILKN